MVIASQTLTSRPNSAIDAADLLAAARGLIEANRAERTLRAYRSDWAHFDAWCARHGVPALPADPSAVALYVTALSATHRPSTIGRRLAAISVAHQRAGHVSPTGDVRVREVMKGVRRTIGTAPAEAAPLTLAQLRRICSSLPDTTIGARDRALLLVGFAGALRRSELTALDADDVTTREEGLVLRLRRSKTDQESLGRDVALPTGRDPETCPVTALTRWRAHADITAGPLLRPVDRHGRVAATRLSAQAVNLIVKRRLTEIGIDSTEYSGHSLRAGFATAAAARGASEASIARQTGHRSMNVLRRYVRHGTVFTDNAVATLGL